MKQFILTIAMAGLGLSAIATPPPVKTKATAEAVYNVDAATSTFKWHAKKVTGEHSGDVKFAKGVVNVEGTSLKGGEFVMDMTSIDDKDMTGEYHDKLNGHLKSEDFFNTAKFTHANLKIKSVTAIKDAAAGANNYDVVADLTIKGITKEIKFPAFVVITKTQVIANANFDIDRTQFDIKYGSKSFFEGIGDKAIDDKFDVKVRVVANR